MEAFAMARLRRASRHQEPVFQVIDQLSTGHHVGVPGETLRIEAVLHSAGAALRAAGIAIPAFAAAAGEQGPGLIAHHWGNILRLFDHWQLS